MSPLTLIAPHARVTYTDRSTKVYSPVPCPSCGYALEWAIATPPIPLTLFSWFDPNGEGAPIEDCPRCGEPLTAGDLTAPNTTGPAAQAVGADGGGASKEAS